LTGTNVINNPFWSADDKFFNNGLADTLEYHCLILFYYLPQHPTDTSGKSFRNLKFPMDWEVFDYIKFPAYMKPYAGGGWKTYTV
jgi:hypothetical protein